MRLRGRRLRVDREVVELLRDEPELLALADAIAATQAAGASGQDEARRWRWRAAGRVLRRLRKKW